jgi:hypothetical protein
MTLKLEDADSVDDEKIYKLCEVIVKCVNDTISYNSSLLRLDKNDFLWTDGGDTWEEFFGTDSAVEEFKYWYTPGEPGFYERHEDTIFSYFKRGNLPYDFAKSVGAPDNEIREENAEEEGDVDEEEEEEFMGDSEEEDFPDEGKTDLMNIPPAEDPFLEMEN